MLVEFPSGKTIYAAGELCDRTYIIVSGKVKIALRSSDGRVKLLTLMGPPDMFGIAQRPEMAEQLLRVMARRLRHTHNCLADLFSADGPAASPSSCCSWRSGSAHMTAMHCGSPAA